MSWEISVVLVCSIHNRFSCDSIRWDITPPNYTVSEIKTGMIVQPLRKVFFTVKPKYSISFSFYNNAL